MNVTLELKRAPLVACKSDSIGALADTLDARNTGAEAPFH